MTRLTIVTVRYVAFIVIDAIHMHASWSANRFWYTFQKRTIRIDLAFGTRFYMATFDASIVRAQSLNIFPMIQNIIARFNATRRNARLIFRTMWITLHCC